MGGDPWRRFYLMADELEQIDISVRIVTPENIAFQYQLAGPFRRLPAYLIDLGIRVGVGILSVFALGLLGIVAGNAAFGLLLLFWFVLEWFYGGLFETFWNGQTPGKRMTGIRVLRIDGQPINGLQAVLRNILRAVDLMPVVPAVALGPFPVPTLMIGLLTPALNRRFQRMGDLVCGTMVVVEERRRLSGVTKLHDARIAQLAALVPAHVEIDRKLGRALSAYVERRNVFTEPRRAEIARELALPLLQRFSLPHDTNHDLFLCALYYRAFVADRAEAV